MIQQIKEFLLWYTSSWTIWFMVTVLFLIVYKLLKKGGLISINHTHNYNMSMGAERDGDSKMQR